MTSRIACLLAILPLAPLLQAQAEPEAKEPLKALLIAGGCCHDYMGQHKVLADGIQGMANVRVDVVWTDDAGTNPPLPLYDNPDWAKGYDVIIHDECAADTKDVEVVKRILAAHQTVPAVHLHCAMHSFRTGTDLWFRHLGLQSSGHGPQEPIAIEFTDTKHPITATLKDWTTSKEELYNNVNVFDAHPLATGVQKFQRNGQEVVDTAIVAWTNEKQGAPSFSTTIGHNTSTVADPRYLELVTRGLLWTCGKLNDEYLQPYKGENKIEFVPKVAAAPKPVPVLPPAPEGATLVTMSASSEQTGNDHYAWHAIDGKRDTRWCAENGSKPQWLQFAFDEPVTITEARIRWERRNSAGYKYRIESSTDAKQWTVLVDKAGTREPDRFTAEDIRYLRITCTDGPQGGWASIWEVSLRGPKIKSLYPKLDEKQQAAAAKAVDEFAKEGNITPSIVKLTAQQEADILKDARVPDGFEMTLFAPWQTANYPVYVAASPEGDLYVSSDGNGSLGRSPHRGRVLRLRDTNQDGRADDVTEFVKDIDSPRGLIWDHDRLYLLHPPHISVYFDRDHDGVAEDSQVLIKDIAFGFKDRPADHTTNGLELGIDGWIYIAGGDFGFLKATGTDGRTLQHRNGGVIRFRPDGSGLEIFSTGTRNILGTPTSPTLDMFARDNTNDGGGWDVRLHHFTGLDDHGYPRLYMNFDSEIVEPLADYGGGSGCGSVYIHEPGFPTEWANAPFTCDWGRDGTFHHSVQPKGATFEETAEPRRFIKVTRPTDADVDGLSNVYQASWKGPATFDWNGPDCGYIVRVTPKGFTPDPLPDFDKLDDPDLVAALDSPSHIRTLAAQRTLLRRPPNKETEQSLLALAADDARSLKTRVAALYTLSLRAPSAFAENALKLAEDAALEPFVLRALGDLPAEHAGSHDAALLVTGTKSPNPRTRLEACVAAARRNLPSVAPAIAALLGESDPVVAHTAFRALAEMGAHEAVLAVLSDPSQDKRKGAAWALMRMHKPEVIDALLARLASESRLELRRPILSTLCRLYHREAEWTGDSWGTRPDTRGPYYQPVPWEQSEKILAALKDALAKADPEEAAFIVQKLNKNRIQSNEALTRIIALANADDKLIPDAVAQLTAADSMPAGAVPLVLKAAHSKETPPDTLVGAIRLLIGTDNKNAIPAILNAFTILERSDGAGKQRDAAREAFLNAPKLENHHLALETLAMKHGDTTEGIWAYAGVLTLASRKEGSPESRQMSRKAIDTAWGDPAQRIALIRTAGRFGNHLLDDRIRVALNDADAEIAKAAKEAVERLKIRMAGEDKTPKIGTLSPEEALAAAVEAKGDPALGESVFSRATCIACHTTSQDQTQKGPYLGNISETYRRLDLAESILDPNKTIAQGFASNVITSKDGSMLMGFVTKESGDSVSLRDIAAQEHTLNKSEITKRETLPTSMMPPGLMNGFSVHEMASLLDYLEQLAK